MNPSCLFKSFLLAATAAGPLRADILPPDSHVVAHTAALTNVGDYPGRIFLALEFYPGNPGSPVAATWMDKGVEARLYGYKLDWIAIYSAPASDRPAIQARLGSILKNAPAPIVRTTPLCAAPADPSDPCVCCDADPAPAADWKTGLTEVPGPIDATPGFAANSSALQSERYAYALRGNGPDTVVLHATLQSFSDGTVKETLFAPNALRKGARSFAPRLSADGRALRWVPARTGVVILGLYDESGRRAWSARMAGWAGQPKTLLLPSLARGRYLIEARGLGWKQSARVDLGER